MDLWIRSQDKEMLKKVNVLYVADDGEEGFSIKHYGERFGIYTTKERALEVLDEIQGILIDYSKMSRVVYQMPKE